MNGKGSDLRKGANLQLYWNHYDNIFRKNIRKEDIKKEMLDDMDKMSYSEFQKVKNHEIKS